MRFARFIFAVSLALAVTACAQPKESDASAPAPEVGRSAAQASASAPTPVTPESPKIQVAAMAPEAAMAAALEACRPLLESMPQSEHVVYQLTPEQIGMFLDKIEKAGAPVVAQGYDLRGHEQLLQFVDSVKNGENVQSGLFIVTGGGIRLLTLAQNEGRQMECTTTAYFPGKEILPGTLEETKGIALTENGYLVYGAPDEQAVNGKGFRVVPLGEAQWAAYRKYVQPLITSASGLMTKSWSGDDLSKLDLPYAFETLYALDTGTLLAESDYPLNSQVFTYTIPGEDVRRIMMKYLPVTEEQLRTLRGYDATADVYHWGCSERGDSPDAEVTAISENTDGSKTLTINQVNLMAGITQAGECLLTVQDTGDGGFRYLSNEASPNA